MSPTSIAHRFSAGHAFARALVGALAVAGVAAAGPPPGSLMSVASWRAGSDRQRARLGDSPQQLSRGLCRRWLLCSRSWPPRMPSSSRGKSTSWMVARSPEGC